MLQRISFRGGHCLRFSFGFGNNFVSVRGRTMIVACALLILSHAGLWAQSNSGYKFRQQSVADGDRYNDANDDAPILSMNCLAANGYGQWSMSTKDGKFRTGAIS